MATRRKSTAKVTPFRPPSGSFIKPDTKFRLSQERHTLSRGLETVGVIFACLFLSAGALLGLFRLARYQKVQLDRLAEINREVAVMEAQVELQRERFAQSFSTGDTQVNLLRRQGFIQPNEVPIKLVERDEQSFPSGVTARNPDR
jgi:hypothetical protein